MQQFTALNKKLTRMIARPLLWIFTGAIPVVMACIYGVATDFSKYVTGKIVDKNTGTGIGNIEVSCIIHDENAVESIYATDYSDTEDGYFAITYDEKKPCDIIRFKDVDGGNNGGSYVTQEAVFDLNNLSDMLIQLEKVK